jgi:hypothetical protein
MRSTIMRIHNTRWIAVAIVSLFTHAAMAQGHQDLAAVIAGGNEALSQAIYGLNPSAYGSSSGIEVTEEGPAQVLKFKAGDFNALNFNDALLNEVNTVVIRFNEESMLDATYDGALLAAMENLNTVVILCAVDVPTTVASSVALNNLPAGVNSYFVISIPE